MTNTAFLGIEASLSNRRWQGPDPETLRQAEAISQRTELPEALARILAGRNVLPDEVANLS